MKIFKLFIIFFLLFSPTAYAQTTPPINLEEIVITSSRMAQHDYKIAANVTVIDQNKIQASNAETVSEIVKEELGVNIYDSSSMKTSVVDIRGFGDTATRNVLVLVNDRKVNSIDISGPDLMQIPLAAVERIEIVRGAGSVLYGDNAVGGIINIITKKGKGPLKGKLGGTFGSYNTQSEDVEISGEKGDLKYYFLTQNYSTHGYRSNSQLEAKDYNLDTSYSFTDKVTIDLSGGWHEDDYGLPGGLNATELMTLGRRGSAEENNYANSKDRFVKCAFKIKPWPEEIDWGHFIFDFSYRNRDTYAWFDYAAWGATATKRDIDTWGLTSKYIYNQKIFGKEVNFVSGIDFYDMTNDILGGGAGASQSSDDLTIAKEEWGLYSYAEYEIFKNIYINGGGRYQNAQYTFDQRNTSFYDTKDPAETVFMGGAKYEYAKGSNIHFNVQQTFRFLATDEWYDTWSGLNTNLKQQRGIQYEIGWKHNFRDTITFHVTPYWIDNKDEIFFNPVSGLFGSNSNYDKTRRTGIEMGQKSDILKLWTVEHGPLTKFDFSTNYTYQEPKFREGTFEDKFIPMVPCHQANTSFEVELWNKYFLVINGSYVGSRFAVNDALNETPPIKPHYLLDAKIGLNLKNIECFFAINNLTNELYSTYVIKSASSTVKDYYPDPERNFLFGIKGKF